MYCLLAPWDMGFRCHCLECGEWGSHQAVLQWLKFIFGWKENPYLAPRTGGSRLFRTFLYNLKPWWIQSPVKIICRFLKKNLCTCFIQNSPESKDFYLVLLYWIQLGYLWFQSVLCWHFLWIVPFVEWCRSLYTVEIWYVCWVLFELSRVSKWSFSNYAKFTLQAPPAWSEYRQSEFQDN